MRCLGCGGKSYRLSFSFHAETGIAAGFSYESLYFDVRLGRAQGVCRFTFLHTNLESISRIIHNTRQHSRNFQEKKTRAGTSGEEWWAPLFVF